MIHDLHHDPRVHPGEVTQELEPQRRVVVERAQDVRHLARIDPNLGLIVALAYGSTQAIRETAFQAPLECAIHGSASLP